jgi:YesN/AraC family two-component response regulator
MSDIRILVADDHPIVREGLIAILDTQEDFEVVGEAASGAEALDLIKMLKPDVLLLDLEMPDTDGLAVLQSFERAGIRCPRDRLHCLRHR